MAVPHPPFQTSGRISECITLAYSRNFNRRNLESFWYPAYSQTLSDLVNVPIESGTLSAVERFNLSLSSDVLKQLKARGDAEDNKEWEDDGDDDEDHNINISEFLKNLAVHHDSEESTQGPVDDDNLSDVADLSMVTNATTPDRAAVNKEPDLGVTHIRVDIQGRPEDPSSQQYADWKRRMGAKACHQCFPLIGELKRAPKRGLLGRHYNGDMEKKLVEAIRDLTRYVSVYFDGDDKASEVIGVCGTGPWWMWAVIERANAALYTDIKDCRDSDADFHKAYLKIRELFNFRRIRYLGSEKSDAELTALRSRLLEIVNADGH